MPVRLSAICVCLASSLTLQGRSTYATGLCCEASFERAGCGVFHPSVACSWQPDCQGLLPLIGFPHATSIDRLVDYIHTLQLQDSGLTLPSLEYPCSMDCLNWKWGVVFGAHRPRHFRTSCISLLIRAVCNKVGRVITVFG